MANSSFSDAHALAALAQLLQPPSSPKPVFDIVSALPRELALEVTLLRGNPLVFAPCDANPPPPSQVLQQLPVGSLLKAGQVCRLWNELALDEGIWIQQVVRRSVRLLSTCLSSVNLFLMLRAVRAAAAVQEPHVRP
jgi:hypothetical protein